MKMLPYVNGKTDNVIVVFLLHHCLKKKSATMTLYKQIITMIELYFYAFLLLIVEN